MALDGPPSFFPRQKLFQLKSLHVNLASYDRVSRFERVAGERCVPELCDGARGVSDPGEPGLCRSHSWVWALVDAHDRGSLRDCDSVGSIVANADVCEFCDAGGALRPFDDLAHGGVAACGQPYDGGAP